MWQNQNSVMDSPPSWVVPNMKASTHNTGSAKHGTHCSVRNLCILERGEP